MLIGIVIVFCIAFCVALGILIYKYRMKQKKDYNIEIVNISDIEQSQESILKFREEIDDDLIQKSLITDQAH